VAYPSCYTLRVGFSWRIPPSFSPVRAFFPQLRSHHLILLPPDFIFWYDRNGSPDLFFSPLSFWWKIFSHFTAFPPLCAGFSSQPLSLLSRDRFASDLAPFLNYLLSRREKAEGISPLASHQTRPLIFYLQDQLPPYPPLHPPSTAPRLFNSLLPADPPPFFTSAFSYT